MKCATKFLIFPLSARPLFTMSYSTSKCLVQHGGSGGMSTKAGKGSFGVRKARLPTKLARS